MAHGLHLCRRATGHGLIVHRQRAERCSYIWLVREVDVPHDRVVMSGAGRRHAHRTLSLAAEAMGGMREARGWARLNEQGDPFESPGCFAPSQRRLPDMAAQQAVNEKYNLDVTYTVI